MAMPEPVGENHINQNIDYYNFGFVFSHYGRRDNLKRISPITFVKFLFFFFHNEIRDTFLFISII